MEIILHIASRDIHILTLQLKVFTSNQEDYTSQCIEINIFGIHSTKRIATYINGNYTAIALRGIHILTFQLKVFTSHQENHTSQCIEINIFGIHSTQRLASYINGNYTAIALRGIHILTFQLKVFTSYQENHTSQCIEINMWYTFH